MNVQSCVTTKPNKRARATLPAGSEDIANTTVEFVSKRRRHSEIASPPRRGRVATGLLAPAEVTTRKSAVIAATQIKPPPLAAREKARRRKPKPPTQQENETSTVIVADSPPFLIEAPTFAGERALTTTNHVRRQSLNQLVGASSHDNTASFVCRWCSLPSQEDETLYAYADMPCLATSLRHDGRKITKNPAGAILLLNPQARARVINFLIHCQCRIPHPPSPYTLYVSISCFDRFCDASLRRGDQEAKDQVQKALSTIGAACLHLASKVEDVWPLDPADLSLAACGMFSVQDILVWERRICSVLDFNITIPTPFDFLQSYLAMIQQCEQRDSCTVCGSKRTSAAAERDRVSGTNASVSVSNKLDPRKEARQNSSASVSQEQEPFLPGVYRTLSSIVKDWKPHTHSAVEACIIFLLELVLTHPYSLNITSDVLAASAIVSTMTVLCGNQSIQQLPSEIRKRSAETAAVMSVYREYLSAEEVTLTKEVDECKSLARRVLHWTGKCEQTDHEDPEDREENELPRNNNLGTGKRRKSDGKGSTKHQGNVEEPLGSALKDILREQNFAVKKSKLTAHILSEAEGHGLNIPAQQARNVANYVLQGDPRKSTTSFEVALASMNRFLLPPVLVDSTHPLGLFGADVVTKHSHAAKFLRPRFLRWIALETDKSIDCQTPQTMAPKLHARKRTN